MKRTKHLKRTIAVLLSFSLFFLYAADLSATKIVKLKLRGGQKNDDGSVTYKNVDAERVREDYSGWSLKCTGKGHNTCAVPAEEGETGGTANSNSDMDQLVSNELISSVNTRIYTNNEESGSFTYTVSLPDGEIRSYVMTWSKGSVVNGEQEYNVEIDIL
jgi:hypothetical protein